MSCRNNNNTNLISLKRTLVSHLITCLFVIHLIKSKQTQASYLLTSQQYHQQQQQQQQLFSSSSPYTSSNNNHEQLQLLLPNIDPFAFSQNVQENQRAVVICTISSGDIPVNFTWLKDNQILSQQVAPTKKITIKSDLDSSTLKISSVRLEHAGNYTCVARNKFGHQAHTAQLNVHAEPRLLHEPHTELIVATRGQTIVIDCATIGWPKPQQKWNIKTHTQGEYEPLTIVEGGRISLASNGSLVIRNADKSDEANYQCKSTNGIGRGILLMTSLKVTVPAHFESPKQQTNVVRRQSQVQLRCDAYGDQPISIEWYKNKVPLNTVLDATGASLLVTDNLFYSIHSNNNPLKNGLISQLLIKQAQRHDNSVYECVTKNAYGRDRTQLELVVQEEPDSVQEIQVIQVSSRSVTVMWTEPYDGRSSITSYMFQYKKVSSNTVLLNEQENINLNTQPSELSSDANFVSSAHHHNQLNSNSIGDNNSNNNNADWWQQAHRFVLPNSQSNNNTSSSLAQRDKSLTIDKLEPSTRYVLRVLAINSIGQSKFSQPMQFSTEEEAPEVGPLNIRAEPINSTSIHVSWDEIPRHKHMGRIQGYYIGYRVANNNSAATTFIYKPFIVTESFNRQQQQQQQQQRLESAIHDLRRDTVYEITVVAFNSRGSGPSSDFVVCKTIEMEAPKAVKLHIGRETTDSIFIEWQRDPNDQTPIDDYVLYQEKIYASQEHLQVRLPGNQTQFKASGLKCGTLYQFYIVANNKVGKSPPSEVVSASTSGAIPVIPPKASLIKMINSTCLLLNLNSFQDNGCKIRTFTLRYRFERQKQVTTAQQSSVVEQQQLVASNNGATSVTGQSTSIQLINSQGLSANHQALTAASQLGGKAVLAGQTSNSAQTSLYSNEWITIRPKSNMKQQQQHQRTNEEDGMEYLCDLNPLGEYTIHVTANNDVGRSEIEYTVLMYSDELRHSTLKELFEHLSSVSSAFSYIPSLLVFLLAGLLLMIVCLILYTTAMKYYQKFIIMKNQMRATRRAKADEKRRRKLANSMLNQSRHSQKLAELWADEYEEEEDVNENEHASDMNEDEDDLNAQSENNDDDDDNLVDNNSCNALGDDEDGSTTTCATDEMRSSSSSTNNSRAAIHRHQSTTLQRATSRGGRRAQAGKSSTFAAAARNHLHLNRQHHQQQLAANYHQYTSSGHQHHYLSNIANSAFDTSSIDSPCNNNNNNKFSSDNSACMSTASNDSSLRGRFQCLNSKQYVKMNEYTMLPTISANLTNPANDIYGTSTLTATKVNNGVTQQQQQLRSSPYRFNTSPNGSSNGTNNTLAPNNNNNNNSLYYSTLRRTSMQTYLPQQTRSHQQQQQQQQTLNRRHSQNVADIYGYYMTSAAAAQQPQAQTQAQVAAHQAANEAANSIFVPPQQIIYSAPNIRRQPQVFL